MWLDLESRYPGSSKVNTPPEPPKTNKQRLEEQREREGWLNADRNRTPAFSLLDEERGGDDRWAEHHAEDFDRSLKPETQVNIVPDKNQGRRPHRVSNTIRETHDMLAEAAGAPRPRKSR